jgi:hypothetical protein
LRVGVEVKLEPRRRKRLALHATNFAIQRFPRVSFYSDTLSYERLLTVSKHAETESAHDGYTSRQELTLR